MREVGAEDDSYGIEHGSPEHGLASGLELEFVWRRRGFRRRKLWERGHAWVDRC